MENIISLLLLLAIWLAPKLIKVFRDVNQQPVGTPVPEVEEEFSDSDDLFEEADYELQEVEAKVPKEPEYFTYEAENLEGEIVRETMEKKQKSKVQFVENEEESKYKLTLEEEEIYKGIIYSEILKKRFN